MSSISDDETDVREDEHEPLGGILLPLGLVLLVIANLATASVWLPARGRGWLAYDFATQPLVFLGILLMKIGLASGLFVWHWMANALGLIDTLSTCRLRPFYWP